MGLLLGLLLLDHLTVVTYGHPILEAPESVTGPWKGDVNIPCTYGPLQGYTQVLVKWMVHHGLDPVTIFLHDSSGDHIQQAKYRGRLQVNHKIPGDVSLQLNTLEMDDRSHYTCEVTWQTPNGNQVVRDKIIELRVQKFSVSKPTVTTGSGYGFTVPQGMSISFQCQAWGSPPINYAWYKEQTNNPEPIKVAVLSTLLFKPAMVADSGSYFCTAKARVGSEQRSNTVKFVVEGKDLPIFFIVLIISLCCIVVFIMAYVMLCRKTSQQEHVYEVARTHAREASNSGEAWRVGIFTGCCSSKEPSSQTPGNDYSEDPCLGQENQTIAWINSDYAHLLHTASTDYELLATKDTGVC
ncbi:V-set and immunoglobulin domain-containing protein 4 isoform X8 [Mustela lutreola]|uniref:V-set and immunoglobulin domain-containing protein 4 isoform X8 n=1 Tax=Mustela lutreola TaxID=9666 RepID=UPI002797640F|nr:V-set and immunoglobulin domain-containing protein 4 isoform X8 [Mustela lutreola]